MKVILRACVCDDGQALIETALCLPIIFLLLAGVVDLGRFAQFEVIVASGAHAGAQYGSQSSITAQNISAIEAAATNDASGVTASAFSYYSCATGVAPTTVNSGQSMSQERIVQNACVANHQLLYVVVTVSATFKPLMLTFLSKTISSTAIMQVPT